MSIITGNKYGLPTSVGGYETGTFSGSLVWIFISCGGCSSLAPLMHEQSLKNFRFVLFLLMSPRQPVRNS
jgi:hypothetical protein